MSSSDSPYSSDLIEELDQLLPQTQCGLCSYGACHPYAQALAAGMTNINQCPPGGVTTLRAIAKTLGKDPTPFLEEMAAKEKKPSVAMIREDECIGCTKCIQACPVDAIIGAAKQMHTVITNECTGCELCIEPCPVDCIEMWPTSTLNASEQKEKADKARKRYQAKQIRNAKILTEKAFSTCNNQKKNSINARKLAIREAITRVEEKKENRS